jgi:hypothetical protein
LQNLLTKVKDAIPRGQDSAERVLRWEVIVAAVILACSLGLRLTGLDVFIANDEIRWTCRSLEFRAALRERDWASTLRTGHPGVVTTWLGAAFIPPAQASAEAACRASAGGMELDRIGTTRGDHADGSVHTLRLLGELLFAGRVGVALFTFACVVVIYAFARLLWGRGHALLCLALVAFDPFYLALSRVLHIDAVLAGLMAISLLSLLVLLRSSGSAASGRRPAWAVVLSGVAGGLAMLEKTPAVFLAPFSALVLTVDAFRRAGGRKSLGQAARDLTLWGLVAAAVYFVFWPAMWVDPIGTIEQVLSTAMGYAEAGHEPGSYFLGRPVHDPGYAFYPAVLLFRLSPVAWVGIIASGIWLVDGRERSMPRLDLVVLWLYSLFFAVFMSLGAKKLDRYLLPIFPGLGIVAAGGLLWAARMACRCAPRIPGLAPLAETSLCGPVVGLVAILAQLAMVLPHHPHYLTYYNPLLGGGRRAQGVLKMGWGEGYERAAAYLNARPDAEQLQVVAPNFAAFAPLFRGETRPASDYSVARTDYVVLYLAQVQRQHDRALMESYFLNPEAQPEHTVVLHGVEYAWVYPNLHHVEPARYVEQRGQPGRDILMVNGDTVFGKRYQGALEVRGFSSRSSPQDVARLLDDLPAGSERVWYPRYSGTDPDEALWLLTNRALLVGQQDYADLKLLLYRLMEEPAMQGLDVRFGDLRLWGHGNTDPLPAWGRDGGVALAWESDRALGNDYTAFVHVYDAHGHRIAQGDSLVVDQELRPTSQWEAGSSGTTLHHLSIPAGTPPGLYDLRVGVYELESGERLPLVNAEAGPAQTYARLTVEIGLPDQFPDIEDLGIAHLLERDIGGDLPTSQLRLLGYDLEHEAVVAGERIPLRLSWKALGRIDQDYRLRLGLRSGDRTSDLQGASGLPEASWAGRDFELVATGYPTTAWEPGAVFREWYDVPVGEHRTTGEAILLLDLVDGNGRSVLEQPLEVADVWVQSREPSFVEPLGLDEQRPFRLGEVISLLGYAVELEDGQPGDTLKVTLYWRADAEIEDSYKAFVHLYDQEGGIVGQRDRLPGLGIRPTSSWRQGEVVADRYQLEIEAGVAPGVYSVAVGMYDAETGERVSAFGPDGERLAQDRILLGELSIGR